MKRNSVRIAAICIVIAIQLICIQSPLLIVAIALVVNVYVAPRESYIIAAAAGLVLDVLHWRFLGLSYAITVLVLLKLCELILRYRQRGEITWQSLTACSAVIGVLSVLPRFATAGIGFVTLDSSAAAVINTAAVGILILTEPQWNGPYRTAVLNTERV